MQHNSKINTVLLVILIALIGFCIWVAWSKQVVAPGDETQNQVPIEYTQTQQNITHPELSTVLPQYIGAQANWPPVIETKSTPYSCVPTTTQTEAGARILEKKINDKTYCVSETMDAAMGSRYGEYTYTTQNGTGIKTTHFALRWSSCSPYDEPQQSECNANVTNFFSGLDALIDGLITNK